MMEYFYNLTATGIFADFEKKIFISDILDVLIIGFLLYTAIFLFKQTKSFLVMAGIGVVLLIYAFAFLLNLALTTMVIRSFLSVFFIAIIVIFQDELKRFFEYLAVLSTRSIRTKLISSSPSVITKIVQGIFNLSGRHYGAILVFEGEESIDRHIKGGSLLDGVLSEEIIVSIFDPSSPGHDGAVVVANDRLRKFGVHLPLTSNFKEIGRHGTRHSAAVGLSERSDAMIIIVSGENGAISVAHFGKLKKINSGEDLEAQFSNFFKSKFTERTGTTYNFFNKLIKENSFEKIVALLVAALFWFLIVFIAR
ncbi:MAG: hypothetical protein COU46_03215 [Candidatus Niyogibacteria bacterium CG10_big_fil_rev_8_21_14_0_10_42_19]|uniref:Diadenylate cyclase n=1 Tax=Candidatus Niyogibacteria bacterium CG10_big_fil_rev_8_21_14_0_10_42_19 TaxID=1974725 RepID=A0A2H0TH37_9BACT|nr:MAG: hypothetical protein COU46_03215 [Candidatus Niyogibacteria bacterium CG10_big_fil_rev_8_21_14_0_10_42_19]